MDVNPLLLMAYMVAFVAATITASTFPPVYQWTSRGWWRNDTMGIHVMMQGIVIALLFIFTLLQFLLPAWVTCVVGIVLCCGVVVIKVNQMRLAIRRRLADDRLDKEMKKNARHE